MNPEERNKNASVEGDAATEVISMDANTVQVEATYSRRGRGANEDFNNVEFHFSPDQFYGMSGSKVLIIFNHWKYKKTRHYKIVPSTRRGTHRDVESLEKTFGDLGFTVVTRDDWNYKDIVRSLANVCKEEHSGTSCMAVAILTHGKGKYVCAADRMYRVKKVINMVQRAPSLAGKPKLFFIQACRAGHKGEGPENKNSGGNYSIHADADSFVLYATYEDFISYRYKRRGTLMIQALCKVVNEYRHLHLTQMATLINQKVAQISVERKIWRDEMFEYYETVKQMPVVEDNLLKLLKF